MEPLKLIKVPLVRQSTSFTCGVAALQSVLAHHSFFYREDKLSKILDAQPNQGTKNWEMTKFIKSLGLEAVSRTGLSIEDLIENLDQDNLVIVAIQAWKSDDITTPWQDIWDHGHYVVTIGYDEHNLYFMDPSTLGNYTFIEKNEFLNRWHDIDQNHEQVIHLGVIISNPNNIKRNDPEKFLPIK